MINKNNYEFKEFLELHSLSHHKALEITQAHRTTFARWLENRSQPPFSAWELLRLHATGEPPCTDNTWHDWRFSDNFLTCTLYRRKFTPTDILMIPALESQARELKNIKRDYALQSKLF